MKILEWREEKQFAIGRLGNADYCVIQRPTKHNKYFRVALYLRYLGENHKDFQTEEECKTWAEVSITNLLTTFGLSTNR